MRARHYCGPMVLALLVTAVAGCARAPAPVSAVTTAPAPPARSNGWSLFRDDFLESYFKAEPAFAVTTGRHEFDGQLPDWSAAGIASELKTLRTERDHAREFKDGALSEAERFERDSVIVRIDHDLFWIETAAKPFKNPAYYMDSLDPAAYLIRDYAPLETRMRAFIKYERAVVAAAGQIRANLRLPLARPLLERGVVAFTGFADFYHDDAPKVFASVAEEALQVQLRQSTGAAEAAMRNLSEWLAANRKSATGDFALGENKFTQMLSVTERVTTPLAQIEKAANADLARNLAALHAACAAFLPGKPLPACVEKAAQNKPAGGPVEGARQQLAELKSFIEAKGFVSIPGAEQALVAEAPAYRRNNFAYIEIPGPFEKGAASVFYIAPPDPSWAPKIQHDYLPGRANLLFASVHEVWPGHFLQFLHSNRSGAMVNRVFVGYAFAEGWAHYGEELMWEEGLDNGDPETHIGQLTNALLRNVRFVCAIGMHAHGMKPAECERLFREEAYADAGGARQQAERGTYDPEYLDYTMGKLMIRKLRDDWTRTRGGQAAWRDFHDRFLSYGGPPIPMVRAAMLGSDSGSLF
jgi:hypothetical protein